MEDISREYPRWMFVGNKVVNGSKYGKVPVLIVKVQFGRFWAKNGQSWKYGTPVNN